MNWIASHKLIGNSIDEKPDLRSNDDHCFCIDGNRERKNNLLAIQEEGARLYNIECFEKIN